MKLLFILLIIFQFKHLFADYFLQGEYMLGKFKPDWSFLKPLLAHVGVHAGMTFFISICLVSFKTALLLALGDAIIHFFMDRIKAGQKYMGRWKPLTGKEWMECKAVIASDPAANEDVVVFDALAHACIIATAKERLRGNVWFWWALGIDQMVHHLTHYGIIYLIMLARA
jgi:Protein of unknown function (DUF3307)